MNKVLRQEWHDLLRAWAVDTVSADQAFEDVCNRYNEPGRFYHTFDHIANVLETVHGLGTNARNLNSVRLAAWLHDVIYDSRASDNEELSADYAEQMCRQLSIPDSRAITSLILKTKTHDADDDVDAKVLLDADLAILGATDPVYRKYAEDIRREYAWVPEPDYRIGRRQVLAKFLARPKIFHFFSALEQPARQNITDEIARLANA